MNGSSNAPRHPLSRLRKRLKRSTDRTLISFVNGLDWWVRDPAQIVDQTPYDIILEQDKLVVRRYRPLRVSENWQLGTEVIERNVVRHRVPVLLIPPLMVKPLIFDLVPNRSFVRTLLRSGFDVYLVDFGEPDKADGFVTLDHYVLDWVPTAVEAVCETAGTTDASLIGYCMGGLFALMYAAVERDSRVRNLVTIASPIDSSKMGIMAWVVKVGHEQIDYLIRRLGNVPGDLSSAAFKMLAPMRSVTRYADLFVNMWNDEYVNGFDALNQWTGNFIDYPGEAFRQFVTEFFKNNALRDGKMVIGDDVADLGRIDCPILAFAGQKDQVVPYSSARAILDVVSSTDKELIVVPGGHMGVFGGRHAPEKVWQPSADWLAQRSAA